MYVAIQAVLSLYASGRTTGIVMDRSVKEGFGRISFQAFRLSGVWLLKLRM